MRLPDYSLEDLAKAEGFRYIVGVDEAGRGPAAGPVVAAAVYIPDESIPKLVGKVNDSKKLSEKRREELYTLIRSECHYGIQAIDSTIIDDINILEATKLAMKSSIEQLDYYDFVLIDGFVDLGKHVYCSQQQIIRGDTKSISIAAASILAKVTRDNIMLELHNIYPIYGWDRNKGYLTKEHIEAINKYGITDFHRLTFKKVGK